MKVSDKDNDTKVTLLVLTSSVPQIPILCVIRFIIFSSSLLLLKSLVTRVRGSSEFCVCGDFTMA